MVYFYLLSVDVFSKREPKDVQMCITFWVAAEQGQGQ